LHININRGATVTAFDITRTIDIKAPAEKVWAAITEPDLIAQWFGDSCEFDATPGGTGYFGWPHHGRHRVVVEHVDKPKTLVYRWARDADVDPVPGSSTVVRFDLTEVEGGTRLTLLETGFDELADPQAAHDDNTGGWKAELGELVEFLESR
jgi:uncharacterized protein YndB with AHSA1/START domain